MRVAALSKHIRSLARKHQIKIKWMDKPPRGGFADFNDRRVFIKPVTTKRRYATALHEIGHLTSKTFSAPQLFQEGAAWAWAKANALLWSPAMQTQLIQCLRSYLREAEIDQLRILPTRLKYPPKNHPFWQLLSSEPDVRKLLQTELPEWLSNELMAIPWAAILAHPERPRCGNCQYWRHIADLESNDTREKLTYGNCIHRHRPLGVEMTPAGALCGISYERVLPSKPRSRGARAVPSPPSKTSGPRRLHLLPS